MWRLPAFPTPYLQKIIFIQIKLLGFTSCFCSWWIWEPNSWIFLKKIETDSFTFYTYFMTKNCLLWRHCKDDTMSNVYNCEWHTWFSPDPLETWTPADFFLQGIFFYFVHNDQEQHKHDLKKHSNALTQYIYHAPHLKYLSCHTFRTKHLQTLSNIRHTKFRIHRLTYLQFLYLIYNMGKISSGWRCIRSEETSENDLKQERNVRIKLHNLWCTIAHMFLGQYLSAVACRPICTAVNQYHTAVLPIYLKHWRENWSRFLS